MVWEQAWWGSQGTSPAVPNSTLPKVFFLEMLQRQFCSMLRQRRLMGQSVGIRTGLRLQRVRVAHHDSQADWLSMRLRRTARLK
jgi:hypothetical protein